MESYQNCKGHPDNFGRISLTCLQNVLSLQCSKTKLSYHPDLEVYWIYPYKVGPSSLLVNINSIH